MSTFNNMTRGITYLGNRMKKLLTIIILLTIITLTIAIPKNGSATTTWQLDITDRTGQQTALTYDQITTMPNTTVEAELYCYGALVTRGQWTGIKITDLLAIANADLTASSIEFTAQDGYKVSIPMETAKQPDVILAYQLDSQPISETLRLVIPMANGNMWIAMVTSMTVSDSGAGNIITNIVGPVFTTNQQDHFSQTTDQLTQNAQHTTTPTPTPNTPNPTPSNTPNSIQTISPTYTSNIPQTSTQTDQPFNLLYVAIAAAAAIMALVSLAILKQKRYKTTI
jgi:hypothetical protein